MKLDMKSIQAMGIDKLMLVVVAVLILLGLNLLGNGINGMVVFDSTVKEICSIDSDCANGQTCCLFYGESSGVCNTKDMCPAIMELTKTEKEKIKQFSTVKTNEDKLKTSYLIQIISGIVIMTIVLGFAYYLYGDKIFHASRTVISSSKNKNRNTKNKKKRR